MPVWEQYSTAHSLSGVGAFTNVSKLTNLEDTDNFQNASLFIVDGIVTVITNSDDLVAVRLYVATNLLVSADLDPSVIGRSSPLIYYEFHCARGPLVFRLRSKKEVRTADTLWISAIKLQGTITTAVYVAVQVLLEIEG